MFSLGVEVRRACIDQAHRHLATCKLDVSLSGALAILGADLASLLEAIGQTCCWR